MSLLDSLKNLISKNAGEAVNQLSHSAKAKLTSAVEDAKKNVEKAMATRTKTFKFDKIPTTVEELKALPGGDMKDPFASVAMTVLALNMYYTDKEAGIAAFDYVMGPGELANLQIQGIDSSIQQNGPYVPISYFEGAKPENNYTPSKPYTIKVYEFATSKDIYDQGYYRLFVKSGGGDSERPVRLRHKPSTDEWFANEFSSLYLGIKKAQKDDEWA
jgi:hypothetical protein